MNRTDLRGSKPAGLLSSIIDSAAYRSNALIDAYFRIKSSRAVLIPVRGLI